LLTASPGPALVNQNVTFTATISPPSNGGTVQFYADGATLGTPVSVSSGTADYSTSTLPVDSHAITAAFSGNATFSPSTRTLAPKQQVCSNELTVTTSNDVGAGSLRDAVANICAGGTVTFAPSLAGQTITLLSVLTIDKNLTLDGQTNHITITQALTFADVVSINPGVTAVWRQLTFYKIVSLTNYGNLTVYDSTFNENLVVGIFNKAGASLSVIRGLFSGNSASGVGGAIGVQVARQPGRSPSKMAGRSSPAAARRL
jgi:hypothetical protein